MPSDGPELAQERHRARRRAVSAVALSVAVAVVLSGCSSTPDQQVGRGSARTTIVVLDNNPLGTYNPVNNHGRNGESRIYQGLFRVTPGQPDTQPALKPLLADGPAVSSDKNRTWTVRTRSGVKFSDGSTFGPEDVAATYRALINPAVASTEMVRWQNLDRVDVTGPHEVVFRLKDPSPEFDRLLLTGIAPKERLDEEKASTPEAVPAGESSLNTTPVGTGPYKLTELRADQAIFEARDDYWGTSPGVKKIVIRHVEDENARAQQLRSGEGDGTVLDSRLSKAFDKDENFTVSARTSADWHGITLPAAHPFVGDQTVRTALNFAVDRKSMVDGALDGHGLPNSTFLAPFYGDAYDASKEIPFDRSRAEKMLDDAGWVRGQDGVRAKDGQRAEFDLIYFTNVGATRKLLALAAASDLQKIGVRVNPVARNSADVSDNDYRTTPLVLGGGSQPYSTDAQLYTVLHSKFAVKGVGAKWNNASDYVNKELDKALDAARIEVDPDERNEQYRKVQAEYAAKAGHAPVGLRQACVRRTKAGLERAGCGTRAALAWGRVRSLVHRSRVDGSVTTALVERRRGAAVPRLIGRRLLVLAPTVVVVTVGVFALAAVSPLDPLDAYMSGQSASLTDEQRAQLRDRLGLDRSWWTAWWQWATAALSGDLGQSLSYRQSVAQVIGDRLPWTLLLSAAGLILALVISLTSGIWAALNPGSLVDRAITALANLLQAVPPFVLGLGTIAIFALGLRLFPTGGLTDPGEGVTFNSLVRHLVLPTIVFALSQVSWLILGLRETVIRTLRDDAVRFARLRGIPRPTIIVRHVLPVSAPPFIALVATRLPELIGGSVIVETVFAWPGIGTATVQAAQRLDLPLLCFLTVSTTAAVLLFTLLADVLYVLLDPRVTGDV